MNQKDNSDKPQTGDADQQQRIADLEKEVGELKDRYLRSIAEMENMRRRSERERVEAQKFALEGLFADFIPVLDTFHKALQSENSEQDVAALRAGFEMVMRQLTSSLSRHGLVEVTAKGEPFDPNLHQAIQRIEDSNVAVETVDQEFARGYTLHGRLVRPALVSVKVPST